MIQSILVYTFIILIMLFFANIAKRKAIYQTGQYGELIQKRSFWSFEIICMMLFFALIFGMRYNVGADHVGYLFSYIDGSVTESLKIEPLFKWISSLCYNFNVHPILYFAIWAFIQIAFFLLFFKDERYLFPLLIIFLFFNGEYLFWMNGIRQAVAMCIWLYSIKFIYEKKFWVYLLFIGIAVLFHRSAIILIVFYPILKNAKDYFNGIGVQLILFVSCFLVRAFFESFIVNFDSVITQFQTLLGGDNNLYRDYTMDSMLEELEREVGGSGIAFIYRIIIWSIIILYSKKLKIFFNSKRFNIVYFFFFFSLLTTYIFPEGAIVFTRPFRYFNIFQTIMLAYFLFFLLKNNDLKFNRLLAYALIVSFMGIFYLNQINLPENNTIWFRFYFQEMD